MTGHNTTSSTATATDAPKAKDLRKKFGVHKAPLVVSSTATAYRRDMNFDEQFQSGPNRVVTHSWVVMDPTLNEGKGLLIRANTYNGNLGERVNYLNPSNTGSIPGFKPETAPDGSPVPTAERKKALKGYSPIALTEVPFIAIKEEEPKEEEKEEEKSEEPSSEDAPDAPTDAPDASLSNE